MSDVITKEFVLDQLGTVERQLIRANRESNLAFEKMMAIIRASRILLNKDIKIEDCEGNENDA